MEEVDSYINKEGIKVIDRFFTVPLDYTNPDGTKIRVFARNLIPIGKDEKKAADLPFLVYLQGGPGFEIQLQSNSGYTKEIHDQGYQTLWLDQRGTGLSTPISHETLSPHLKTDEEKAQYLKLFRADNIVNDCEFIRKLLLAHLPADQQKWTILGQSFGGFCSITYLSFHPEGLKEVFITGGLAPLVNGPDQVYEALVPRVIKRNKIYYEKYPKDIKRVRDLCTYLQENDVTLPNGGRFTPNRLLHLGIAFGAHGGIDSVHQQIFRASNDLAMFGKLSYKTLQIQCNQSLDGNPLYAILHEPIYCQGTAPNWSAARIMEKHPQFQWNYVKGLNETEPVYFSGEMIFPEMFDDFSNLRPLKGVAEVLAKDSNWGPLYDLDQLAKNEVKVTAVTYFEDMYVDFNFAQDTASKIKNTEQYITNQLFHNGIRQDSKDVIKRLFDISKRVYD